MSDVKLGELIQGKLRRDAIHIAVAPVVAGQELRRGQNVTIAPDGRAVIGLNSVGIVDPFLGESVVIQEGEQFWLCLYQNAVTGIRHHWSHPVFSDEDGILEGNPSSKAWLMNFADSSGISYGTLMDGAYHWLARKHDGYDSDAMLSFGGLLEGKWVGDDFWEHFEKVTGKKGSGNFFTCSC